MSGCMDRELCSYFNIYLNNIMNCKDIFDLTDLVRNARYDNDISHKEFCEIYFKADERFKELIDLKLNMETRSEDERDYTVSRTD